MPGNDYANLVDIEPTLGLPPSVIQMFIDSSTTRTTNIEAQVNSFRDSDKDAFNAGAALGVGVQVIYRLRGYFIGGATYEFWTGTSTATPNPSGNPLAGVVIDAVIS